MICPVCNRNIPDGSNYCPACAADLTKHRRQMGGGWQQPSKRQQQPDPRMMPPQQDPMMQQQFSGKYPYLPPQQQGPMMPPPHPQQQRPMTPQQYTGQYAPFPPQQGEGGLLEGITPRGKLFFGVGGLVLVGVLALLVVNLFGGGGAVNQPTPPPFATESPTYAPYGFDIFETPEPDDDEGNSFDNLFVQPTAPPATAMPVFTVLKRGVSGPEVTRLQERLQLLGYLPADATIDGIYGTATVNAVKEFQRKSGLPTDGDAGPVTQTRLFSIPIDTGEPEPGIQNEEPINQPG